VSSSTATTKSSGIDSLFARAPSDTPPHSPPPPPSPSPPPHPPHPPHANAGLIILGFPWLLWLLFLLLGFIFGLLLCWCCRKRLWKMMGKKYAIVEDSDSDSKERDPLLRSGAGADGAGAGYGSAGANVNLDMGGGGAGAGSAGADVNVVMDLGAQQAGGSSSTTNNTTVVMAPQPWWAPWGSVAAAQAAQAPAPPPSGATPGDVYTGVDAVVDKPVKAASFRNTAAGPDVRTEDVAVGTESLAAPSGGRAAGYVAPASVPRGYGARSSAVSASAYDDAASSASGASTAAPPAPPPARMRERASGPDVPGLTVSGTVPGDDKGCAPMCIPKRTNRWGR
jgi:hypothetical protein